MSAVKRIVLASLLGLAVLGARPAAADVTGKLTLTGNAGRPPMRGKAFLPRIENPYTGGKMIDPMPYIVVVLTADGVQPPANPPSVVWKLVGESFDHPLIAVPVGTEVRIRNEGGRRQPTLFVDGQPDAMPKTPLNKGGERSFKANPADTLLVIKDEDTPHLSGACLVLGTPYFAVATSVGKNGTEGKFSIAGVADGTYHVKVWYRTGWLDGVAQDVTVEKGKASVDLTLPPGLKIAGAADASGASGDKKKE